ncbi:MAG: histidine phosphatase family protein [Caldilineaceae bacterium]
MIHFYLVRHAHADWQPDENRGLSTQGQLAAAHVAMVLAPYPIRAIYASPYQRAIETVEPFAQQRDLPIVTLPALRERQLAGEPVADFAQAVEAVWRDPHFAHLGGESNVGAQQRGVAALEELRHSHNDGEHIVLATHGNLLALILQHYDQTIGYAFWKALTMPDVYRLSLGSHGATEIERIYREPIS